MPIWYQAIQFIIGTNPKAFFSIDPQTPIGVKWLTTGGEAKLGPTLSDAEPILDGEGLLQLFQNGAIFWSPAFGAILVSIPIFRKWASPSVEQGVTGTGEIIQHYLGFPTDDSASTDSIEFAYFERGMIVSSGRLAHVIYADIYAHYRELGGLGSFLGPPIADDRSDGNGGRVSTFLGGDIYYSDRTGSHEVHGAIRDRWLNLGGPTSILGYPVSDEEQNWVAGEPIRTGRHNRFEQGGIYWTPETGAWEVYGDIFRHWQSQGGPMGQLGCPTSGETDTPNSGGRFNEFERGVVVWHGSGVDQGTFHVLDLRLNLYSYSVNDDFNVQVHITATPSAVNHGRMPADDNYDAGTQNFDPPLSLIDVDLVRGDTAISVWLLAIHEETFGKDDRKGTIVASYTIDNLWGLNEPTALHHNGAFDAQFRVHPKTAFETNDPNDLFWPFRAPKLHQLSWDTYAQTFRDVVETDKHINLNPLDLSLHPWEIFFYEIFYRSLAQTGTCFGHCLEAIYARENRSVFVEPLRTSNAYTKGDELDPARLGDQDALNEISTKHGYQVGARFIEWFLGKWTAGALHDPLRAYWESYYAFQSGNWPILTLSNEDKFKSGHVVLPYRWSNENPDAPILNRYWSIAVKNPQQPQPDPANLHAEYVEHSKIDIDPRTQKFSFTMTSGAEWTGSALSGGRLLCVPFSELNSRPVTPGHDILALLTGGVIIVLAGDAETTQISDGLGRTFFRWDKTVVASSGVMKFEKNINWDVNTRVPDFIEIPNFGAVLRDLANIKKPPTEFEADQAAELYHYRPERHVPIQRSTPNRESRVTSAIGMINSTVAAALLKSAQHASIHYEIRGTGNGKYRWSVAAPRMSASVLSTAEDDAIDSIYLGNAGGHTQHVTVSFPNAKKARHATLFISGWRGQQRQHSRTFVMEDLILDKGQSIRARVSDGGRELIVENGGPSTTFNLKLLVGLPAAAATVRPHITLDADRALRMRIDEWTPSKLATAPIHAEVLEGFGGKVVGFKTL